MSVQVAKQLFITDQLKKVADLVVEIVHAIKDILKECQEEDAVDFKYFTNKIRIKNIFKLL